MLPKLVFVTVFSLLVTAIRAQIPDWWENAVVYQIYPLSYKDSDNSGEGDLNGITSKLDHLQDIGVTAAWLSPIFQSPGVDQGYDISDYTAIDSKFGTMADFDAFVTAAHTRGIKVVLDFVPNHSSDQHQWFISSANRDPQYENYYVWRDGVPGTPPNNWKSLFGGPAWTYHTGRGQYYLHQFAKEQPDLNYRNTAVRDAMKAVLQFWLERGVDGFRLDAVPYLIEDDAFGDEPVIGDGNDHNSLQHIYTSDQDETFNIIYEFREFVDAYTATNGGETRVLMTEAYTDIKNTMRYYLNEANGRLGAHFTFNFNLISYVNGNSNARDIVIEYNRWMSYMPLGCVPNWVIGNHDNHRAATRFGTERVDGLNMLIAFLPGVMVTYNGEEIGQENGEVTWEQCMDPRACNGLPEDYEANSRDFERTPFHWDATVNAGFNTGTEPWLPVSQKYLTNNLQSQKESLSNSHYQVYKQLLAIRKETSWLNGAVDLKALSDYVIGGTRTAPDGSTYLFAFNIGDSPVIVDARSTFRSITTPYLQVRVRSSTSTYSVGKLLASPNFVLYPYESIIAAVTNAVPGPNPQPTDEPSPPEIPDPTVDPTEPDGAGTITFSVVTLIVTLYCSLFLY